MKTAVNLQYPTDIEAPRFSGEVIPISDRIIPEAYLDDAEPSPLMGTFSKVWRCVVKTSQVAAVVGLVAGYPLGVFASHIVDSSPVELALDGRWASVEVGTALVLLDRELTNTGWATDRSSWHPQARLVALPAWQEGVISSLSDYVSMTASHIEESTGQSDRDLLAASRLLEPMSDGPGEPRLNAATEALLRYDGRLARGLAATVSGQTALVKELETFQTWAIQSRDSIQSRDRTDITWPASRADIELVYLARARAHVASELLSASLSAEPQLIRTRTVAEAVESARTAWRRAAAFNPLFVSSQDGTGLVVADHPATMAQYLSEAQVATQALSLALSEQRSDTSIMASTLRKVAP